MTPSAPICGHAILLGTQPRRGLCVRCHAKLSRQVAAKKLSWVEAEQRGLCGPQGPYPWTKGACVSAKRWNTKERT